MRYPRIIGYILSAEENFFTFGKVFPWKNFSFAVGVYI